MIVALASQWLSNQSRARFSTLGVDCVDSTTDLGALTLGLHGVTLAYFRVSAARRSRDVKAQEG